jgi:hypothetical protein
MTMQDFQRKTLPGPAAAAADVITCARQSGACEVLTMNNSLNPKGDL